MSKFRIVAVTPSGSECNTRYYVEKRERFLFVPYWAPIRSYSVDPIIGNPLFFWNFDDAKKFIKDYHEKEIAVVYEE